MEGIHFVTDEKGEKIAVQIDLKRYGDLWEDFCDQLVAEERSGEKREPYQSVRKRLIKTGTLRG
jgi:hypothetical protein